MPSASSSTATSTTRTYARSSVASAPSQRARSRSTSAATPTCSRSKRSATGSAKPKSEAPTEVCLQGGIHPNFDGDYYVDVVAAVRAGSPTIHIHAFSALEVFEGARRSGQDLATYLTRLKDAGLKTLPGTAAEILDDDIRPILCPDKIKTDQWLEVHRTAHSVGLRSNITIMFGAVESPEELGHSSAAYSVAAERDRRIHRVRAAPLRAHGDAAVLEGPLAKGSDLS